jgi:hypothetical protein
MTFEESMDRLKDRHEALTQSVELLFHAQDRHDKQLDRLEQMQAKNETIMAQLMETVGSLARIAQAHENRISGLDAT